MVTEQSGSPSDYRVGYGKPPRKDRFRSGQSGNPCGRPPGQRGKPRSDAVLDQTVTIRENGCSRNVTMEVAFLLHQVNSGMGGNVATAQALLRAYYEARAVRADIDEPLPDIVLVGLNPGNVDQTLAELGMAIKVDPLRRTAHMKLEPWLVQLALDRLGDHRFTLTEQAAIRAATRRPSRVAWPEGWAES